MDSFDVKILLMTGGTGSFGNAALKQVPSCEFFPTEAIRACNIFGIKTKLY